MPTPHFPEPETSRSSAPYRSRPARFAQRSGRALPALLAALLLLSLGGCSMFKLGKDLDVLYQGLSIISGQIDLEGAVEREQPGTIVVLLTQPIAPPRLARAEGSALSETSVAAATTTEPTGAPTAFRLVDYRLADGKRRFNFQAPAGVYRLMAFIDRNGDFVYQPGEPATIQEGASATNRLDTPRYLWRFNKLEIENESALVRLPVEVDLTPNGLQKLERTATTMGVEIDFASKRFRPEAVALGMWEPTRWFLEVGYGFYLLEPWDENEDKPLLLFIHGISGSPRDFEKLLAKLDTDDYRVALFHYPSGLRIEDNAYMLSQTMNELSIRSPGQRYTVIGHSMGGLVAKRFIEMQANSRQAGLLERFISISTPWLGHGGAGAGVEYAPVVAPAWEDLAPGSDFLEELAAFELPATIDYTLIFSHGGNTVLMPDGNDGVVSMDSQLAPAMQDRANQLIGVSQDHVGILAADRTAKKIRNLLDR